MFKSLKRFFKFGVNKSVDDCKSQSLLFAGFIGVLEAVLFWENIWFSLFFIFCFNIIFLICVHRQISLIGFLFCISITVLIMDAFEAWLKYKHRVNCLKRLASYESTTLKLTVHKMYQWIQRRWMEFKYLRATNHTKAFLITNLIFGFIFLIGMYINGYLIVYVCFTCLCIYHKVACPISNLLKRIHQDTDSDGELEGLIPDVSEEDIKLLAFEPDPKPVIDEKQSLDYWKPHDIPLEEGSDSSENSTSLVTNLSMASMQTFEKDVDTSDSSEDEYMPIEQQQKEQLISTMEIQPSNTWSSSAFNAFWNLTGAVTNMIQTSANKKRNRVSSVDSSDGFEMIDENDLK